MRKLALALALDIDNDAAITDHRLGLLSILSFFLSFFFRAQYALHLCALLFGCGVKY